MGDVQVDYAGLRLLDAIGDDRVMWASDYPHSTWPDSQRGRILCDHARELYGL